MWTKNTLLLTSLTILILTHFIQLTNKRSQEINNFSLEHSFKVGVIAWARFPSCSIKVFELSLIMQNCTTWRAGDEVTIIGSLPIPGAVNTSSQKVLIKKVKYSSVGNQASPKNRLINYLNFAAFSFSQRRASIFSNLGEKQSSLLLALIFGQSNLLSPQLRELFTRAGLQNLISVSSYSFSLTIESLFILGKVIPQKKKVVELMTLLLLTVYILLVGYPLALQRVVWSLFIEYLATRFFLRPILPLYKLLLSTLLVLAINPYAFLDIGLQFSVLARLGIQIFRLPTFFLRKRGGRVAQLMWLSFIAQIFTFPLIFFYFGQLSLISPFSNAAVIWILPTILGSGMAYWLIGQVYTPLLSALMPFLSAQLVIFMVELRFLASLGVVVQLQFLKEIVVLGYCLIALLLFGVFINHKRHIRQAFQGSLLC